MSWDPMRDLRAWQERLAALHAGVWMPAIDVYGAALRDVVAADWPGMMLGRTIVFGFFMSTAFFAGLVLTPRMRSAEESVAADPDQASAAGKAPAVSISGSLPDLTTVAQRAVGSVTNISSTQIVRTSN